MWSLRTFWSEIKMYICYNQSLALSRSYILICFPNIEEKEIMVKSTKSAFNKISTGLWMSLLLSIFVSREIQWEWKYSYDPWSSDTFSSSKSGYGF